MTWFCFRIFQKIDMFKKIFLQILLSSVSVFFFTYFFFWIFLQSQNAEFLYNFKNRNLDKISSNLVVVEIDDLTYSKLWFPIERSKYIPFLENLQSSNPLVVWFDILFLDKWNDANIDKNFADEIKKYWNIVLWFDIKNDKNAIMPYNIFKNWAISLWYFQPFVNQNTKMVSSIEPFRELFLDWKKSYFESFSFALLRAYFNKLYSKEEVLSSPNINKNTYNFFNKEIPIVDSSISGRSFKEFFINYSHPNSFQRESFYNIYSWNFDKEKFKDKIVLIWYTAEWVKDDFLVPSFWMIKWVYIHANAINNILNDNYIIYFDKKLELIASFLFIMLLMYINLYYLKTVNLKWISLWALFLSLVLFFFYLILFFVVNSISGVYLLPNFPLQFLSVLFLSFFVSSTLKYVNEDKNKKLLSKALSEYVSSDIVSEILTSSWTVKLNWERKKITIFFSDIAWFTTISEKLNPEDLVSFLKIYLWSMSDIIMDNRWFINKYEWDAIMALWWVFKNTDDFWVIDACNSSLLQLKELKKLNEKFKEDWKDEINIRIWIHTWDAIIWNIWSEWRKMEFTALWDSVNLASRLEGVNKYYWSIVCASENVYEIWKDLFVFRYLDKIRVKWKNNWVNIYELVWYKHEISDLKIQIINDFQKAIRFYFEKDFQKAKEIFEKLSALWDEPSKVFFNRCEIFLKNWIEDDWDWIWKMEWK